MPSKPSFAKAAATTPTGGPFAPAFAPPATSGPRAEVAVQIMSNPLYLSGTRELIAGVARRLGFSDEACSHIALAVDEALANVIRHGYGKACDKPIWISLFPIGDGPAGGCPDGSLPKALKIIIEDEARQVDPCTIKSRDLDEIRPGGLGVHIIKTVMDFVLWETRGPSGMRLTMVKNRGTGSPNGKIESACDGKRDCCG